MICWFAGQPTIFMYIHTSTGEKTVYWVVIRQIGGLFNQHNATNSKSFTGQLLYLLDYRAYTWQITAKSRTNVHLADNNNLLYCKFTIILYIIRCKPQKNIRKRLRIWNWTFASFAPHALKGGKSFWPFSPYINHLRNLSSLPLRWIYEFSLVLRK